MTLPTDPHDQAVALRALQRPLKDRYRADPAAARQSSSATAHVVLDAVAAEVPQWPGTSRAGLHPATGGDGTEACSGDMLLEALAGCAAVTLRSVAAATGLALRSATVHVVGHWDARGTLGVDREVPVGFTDIEVRIESTPTPTRPHWRGSSRPPSATASSPRPCGHPPRSRSPAADPADSRPGRQSPVRWRTIAIRRAWRSIPIRSSVSRIGSSRSGSGSSSTYPCRV